MPRSIEYFFTLQSPWAYLGHTTFTRLAARFGAEIRYRPVKLGEVFSESGGLPLAKRHPVRQRYRILELQRWIEARGLPMKLHPRYWPVDPTLADQVVIAAMAAGGPTDTAEVVARLFSAVFEREENIADEDVLRAILREMGFDAPAVVRAARAGETAEVYAGNVARAVALDVIGSPAYVLDGESFWGQDRLPLLESALQTGRAPYLPEA